MSGVIAIVTAAARGMLRTTRPEGYRVLPVLSREVLAAWACCAVVALGAIAATVAVGSCSGIGGDAVAEKALPTVQGTGRDDYDSFENAADRSATLAGIAADELTEQAPRVLREVRGWAPAQACVPVHDRGPG